MPSAWHFYAKLAEAIVLQALHALLFIAICFLRANGAWRFSDPEATAKFPGDAHANLPLWGIYVEVTGDLRRAHVKRADAAKRPC